MQLLATNSELFDVSFEVVSLSRTLTNISEDTDGSPVPVPMGATDLASALSLISSVSSDTIPAFSTFSGIYDAIVSIAWLDSPLAEKKLSKTAADMLANSRTPDEPGAGMRLLLGIASSYVVEPESLNVPPTTTSVDDTKYSIASHLIVDELVELKNVSFEWRDISRSVLTSRPYNWGPPPEKYLRLWEARVLEATNGSFPALPREILFEEISKIEASALLEVVAPAFFKNVEAWKVVDLDEYGDVRYCIKCFLWFLRKPFVEAVGLYLRDLAALVTLNIFREKRAFFDFPVLPARVFDSEIDYFIKTRHCFLARCSDEAILPHINMLFDMYTTLGTIMPSHTFRATVFKCLSRHPPLLPRLFSFLAGENCFALCQFNFAYQHPGGNFWVMDFEETESAAVTNFLFGMQDSVIKEHAIHILRILDKATQLHQFEFGSHLINGTRRVVDAVDTSDVESFVLSARLINDTSGGTIFDALLLRHVNETTLQQKSEWFIKRLSARTVKSVPDISLRFNSCPAFWERLIKVCGNGIDHGAGSIVFQHIDVSIFDDIILPLLAELPAKTFLSFFYLQPIHVKQKRFGVAAKVFCEADNLSSSDRWVFFCNLKG